MADQVREAFENWFSDGGEYPLACQRSRDGGYLLAQAEASWTAWQAATASHAAEVEALRAFFRDVAELTMDHDRIELPGGDYAVVYPNKLGQALAKVDPNWTRAALKGDKP